MNLTSRAWGASALQDRPDREGFRIHSGVHEGVAAVLQGDQVRPDGYRAQFFHHRLDAAAAQDCPVVERQGAEAEHGENGRYQDNCQKDYTSQRGKCPPSEP